MYQNNVDKMSKQEQQKLVLKRFDTDKKQIQVNNVVIGDNELTIIAGPCAVESEKQLMAAAEILRRLNVSIMRASIFKPRTSPYSFQGLGIDGLEILKQVKNETGILIESEIMHIKYLEIMAEHIDILRIGSRNMHNFDLLREVGKLKKPVILKRGFAATLEELMFAAEYILVEGNENVIFCERGIRTFENAYRNTLDIAAIHILKSKTRFPVIADPSHAAGRCELVFPLSRAAVAAGADGLLIEFHPCPNEARCDRDQALSSGQLENLLNEVFNIKRNLYQV